MKRHHIKVHLICWAIYIMYEILVAGMLSKSFHHFFAYFFFYLLNISLFYTHAVFVMPRSFAKPPISLWRLPLLLILEFSLYIGLVILISLFLDFLEIRHFPLVLNSLFFVSNIWRAVLFILYSTGYFFLIRYITRTKEQMQKAIEVEQLKVKLTHLERDYLRAQITPHLLFNTLNFVKYAAKHRPEQSDEAIIRLSEILDFSISKSADGMIPITQEIKQIENIIRLNQLRFNDKLQINYEVQLDKENIRILPIILLTLVENVFKHGDLTDANYPTIIRISAKDNLVSVVTENLPNNGELNRLRSGGTGLKNIEMRLKEQYGDEGFHFQHGKEGRYYKVLLRMPCKTG